jgi:hypothetical protein
MKIFAMNMNGNTKTGRIPVTTSGRQTCPITCPLYEKGCYAKYNFLGNFWKKLTEGKAKGGLTYNQLLEKIESLPIGTLWRMNQAGDLQASRTGRISTRALKQLIRVNKGKNGFTYTHHRIDLSHNRNLIDLANKSGFTVNLSSNNLNEADWYLALNIAPVCTLLEVDAPNVSYTPLGNKVIACPAEKSDKVTCETCKLCAITDRDYVIGFRAHGSAKKTVDLIASDKGSI